MARYRSRKLAPAVDSLENRNLQSGFSTRGIIAVVPRPTVELTKVGTEIGHHVVRGNAGPVAS